MDVSVIRNAVRVLVAAAALFTLSGCNNAPFKILLINEGAYPITEVLVYPTPDRCADPGPAAQVNRMPRDDSGATIALPLNQEVMLPWLFRQDVYEIWVTFYDSANHLFRRVHAPGSYDLTFVKSLYPVVIRAVMGADNTPVIEIEFTTRF